MALAAAAAAAAGRRLACSRGLAKVPSLLGIRHNGAVPDNQAPSKEEMELFVKGIAKFLQRAESSLPQEEFSQLMKELSSDMSTLVLNKGVLYPTELSNLVATFVPVAGTYMPQKSKLVIVDLVRRIEDVERTNTWRSLVTVGAVGTFVGIAWYWPSIINKLELSDKTQSDQICSLDTRFVALDTKAVSLGTRVSVLEEKVAPHNEMFIRLENKVAPLEGKVTVLEHKVAPLESKVTQLEEKLAMETSGKAVAYTCVAGIGLAITCVVVGILVKK